MGKKQRKSLRVGIVRFPCSNCDLDTLHFFQKFGHVAEFIWYKGTRLNHYDVLVLPGGFAFGDRVYKKATGKYVIDPGAQAINSPIIDSIYRVVEKGIAIIGICNGFQILVKAGLLPGKLLQNESKKFYCDWVNCEVTGNSFFSDKTLLNKSLRIPIAHGYGRYVIDNEEYHELLKNGQIFLRYKTINPNGSAHNIAGVCNMQGTIFGMMPHPERTPDGKYFISAIEKYVYG